VTLFAHMNFPLFLATVLDVGPASGYVTLEYEYMPVSTPEPPSLWLALTAGVFISLRIRLARRLGSVR
jgi:hypothetical protein